MQQFAQMGFPELYERELVAPLFRPFAEDLVSRLRVAAGERVLDLACGTGVVARLAAERVGPSGRVVAVDLNPGMIGVARAREPRVDWREGDAQAPPLDANESFDVVTCQQGLQFLPDPAAAIAAMRRALRAGGRIGVSTWRPDEEMPFLVGLRRIAEQVHGPIADRRHALGDAAPLESMLADAGFSDITTETVSKEVRFPDGAVFVYLNAMALVSMSASGRSLGESERQQAAADLVERSRALTKASSDAQGLKYDIASNVVTARG